MKFKAMIFIIIFFYQVIFLSHSDTFSQITLKDNFEKITIENGLSNGSITTIFQDSKGYMWFGTSDGLNRYDGKTIIKYNYSSNNENGLISTYITSIAEDSEHNLWIGTDLGLNIWLRKEDKIIKVKNNIIKEFDTTKLNISSVLKDKKGYMWVGTDKGLYKISSKSKKLLKKYTNDDNSLASKYSITALKEDNKGHLWIGTKSGLMLIEDGDINRSIGDNTFSNITYINSVEISKSNELIISSKDKIYKYNIDNEKYSVLDLNIDQSKQDNLDNIMIDNKNNLWISSSNGAIKYNLYNNTKKILQSQVDNTKSLSSDIVSSFYEDKNGIIWIGTDNGVNVLSTSNKFNSLINSKSDKDTLSSNNITSIIEDSDGYIWVGNKYHGIDILDKDKNIVKNYTYDPDNPNSIVSNNINYITQVDDSKIIICTDIGVSVYNLKTDKFENRDDITSEIYAIYTKNKNTWVSSSEGFYLYNSNTLQSTYYDEVFSKYDINSSHIRVIYPDPNEKDILWLAGKNIGLIKFHVKTGIVKIYLHDNNANSIISNSINCINSDNFGNLWIGTNLGLDKLDLNNNYFTHYSMSEGLSQNYINAIQIDNRSNLWISTNYGIDKLNPENNKFINFNDMDGLQAIEYNSNSTYKLKDGTIFFGSNKGLTFFKPEEIVEPTYHSNRVVIGDIFINGERIVYDDNKLVLKHNKKNFTAQFFLPDYKNLNKINYQYTLVGFDKNWSSIQSTNEIYYRNLNPGEYRLDVRARDSHGKLSKTTSLNITVKKPIWRSNAAYIMYLFIFIVLVAYTYNYVKILRKLVNHKTMRLNRQLQRNKDLSNELLKKEKFKNNYFVNLSHELRTPINVILSTIQLFNSLNDDKKFTKEKINRYMNMINRNSQGLLKIINDIIDSSKLEAGEYKINKKSVDIVFLVEETALNMSDYIKEKDIELIIDTNTEENYIICDDTEIERCIVNLIANAVKFTSKGGTINVDINCLDKYIEISIKDTGIGISLEDQEFIFKRFTQVESSGATKASSSGIGLTLVKHIVELHGGKITLESELNKGSKFTILIPSKDQYCLRNDNLDKVF